jgi:hypothetical protein
MATPQILSENLVEIALDEVDLVEEVQDALDSPQEWRDFYLALAEGALARANYITNDLASISQDPSAPELAAIVTAKGLDELIEREIEVTGAWDMEGENARGGAQRLRDAIIPATSVGDQNAL